MRPEHWQRASELFELALEIAPDERAAWLAVQCTDDEALRRTVENWLAADAASGGFLEQPILGDAFLGSEDFSGDASDAIEGTMLGPYRMLRPIGSGGMGEVWLAERHDGEFEKRVAIKRLLCPTPELVRHFRHERRVLAGLQHPNIAQLFDGNLAADGTPYFVMEYVEGEPITVFCENRQLDVVQRLTLFLQVCDAVQYAHRNLVVHRDIKPANILVNAEGETKLLDFGIAKVLENAGNGEATATIARRLTPDYAAPEQILGAAVTTATDVYSLGVLLFELIAGERPYRIAHQRRSLEHAIVALAPMLPSAVATGNESQAHAWAGQLRGDLDRIAMRALAKEPERRYPTAQALADDVRRFLAGRPIVARADDAWYRMSKFISRNRAATVAVAVMVLSLFAATGISLWEAARARHERNSAVHARDFVLDMLSNVTPYRRSVSRSTTLTSMIETSAPRVLEEFADEPQFQVPLLRSFAGVFLSLGRARDSAKYLEYALQRERASGADVGLTIETQLAIANDYYYLRRFDDSNRITDEVLAQLAKEPGDQAHQRLGFSAREIKLLVTWVRGDYDGAKRIADALLHDMRQTLGSEDKETASAESYLTYLLLDRKQLDQAGHLIEHYASVDLANFPAGYPGNYGDANVIAWWLIEDGDAANAEAIASTVLDLRNRIYFGQGFAPAFTHFMRGWARCRLDRYEEGLADFDAALAVLADSGNVGYMYISRIRLRQAECLFAAGKTQASAVAYTKVREMERADGGAETPLVEAATLELARITGPRSDRDAPKSVVADRRVVAEINDDGKRASLGALRSRLLALAARLTRSE
jgi:serine/threonine-protein kinase